MNKTVLLGLALILVFLGCSSTPVAVAPVGPNPSRLAGTSSTGQLEVFSAVQTCRDGDLDENPAWCQHTDYTICNVNGKRIRHVFNTVGHYEESPRVISLPPGRYTVKAQAKDYFEIDVPVIIERGRITRVHLDDDWKLPGQTAKSQIVSIPTGYAVGWRAK